MHSSNDNDGEIKDINITPMVDIMLVLLVIFMVTANFLNKESININLPKVTAADPNTSESIQIAALKDGSLMKDGKKIKNEDLMKDLARQAKYRPNLRVTLSADENLSYGTVAAIMGKIRQSGVSRIALSVNR